MDTDLTYLAEWFDARCDGVWEHRYGITIQTADNPGWIISIDSADGTPFPATREGQDLSRGQVEGRATATGVTLFSKSLSAVLARAAAILKAGA